MDRLAKGLLATVVLLLSMPLLLGALMLAMLPAAMSLEPTPTACGTGAAGGWMIPFGQTYAVTSEYGWREHPVTGQWKLHTGIDLAATAKPGRVLAAGPGLGLPSIMCFTGPGTITTAGVMGGYGNAVVVDHGGGVSTLYGHLAGIDPAATVGAAVTGGTLLGIEGATGTATGMPSCVWPPRIRSMPRTRPASFRSTSMPLCDNSTTSCAPLARASSTTFCRFGSWMPNSQSATK